MRFINSKHRQPPATAKIVIGILMGVVAGWVSGADRAGLRSDFCFVHITDIHATVFAEEIGEINALSEAPAFVVATGDLLPANGNDPEQFKTYLASAGQFRFPVYNLPGNHDYSTSPRGSPEKWPKGVQNYRTHVGENNFSFDHGAWHFIAVDSQMPEAEIRKFLADDLKRQPADRPIIVFQHKEPSRELLDYLNGHNVKALFHGHWHATKRFTYGKINVFCTPPLAGGNSSFTPRGFRVVRLKGGEVTTEMRVSGISQQLTIVSPVEGIGLTGASVPILVAGYDTSASIARCEYRMHNGEWQALAHAGGWLYKGTLEPTGLPAGAEQALTVRVTDNRGRTWEKTRRFGATPTPFADIRWCRYVGGTTGSSSPVVDDGRLYIGMQDDDNGSTCGVAHVDTASGELRWTFKTGSSVHGRVAFARGMAYAVSVTGTVHGIDASSGMGIWEHQIGDVCQRWLYNGLCAMDGTVYAGAAMTVALDGVTGKEAWTASLGLGREWSPVRCSPQATATQLYVGFPLGGLFALNRQTGVPQWNCTEFGKLFPDPAVAGDTVYFAGAEKLLFAVNATAGKVEWERETGKIWVPSSPAVQDNRLVIGLDAAGIGAFNRQTGELLWRRQYSTRNPIGTFGPWRRGGLHTVTSPVIAGETVYLGSTDGHLYTLDLTTGQLLWHFDFGVPVLSSPCVSGRAIYISTFDGNLYCFGRKEGKK